MTKIFNWFKTNFIFTIVLLITITSCFFVPIGKGYLSYFSGAGKTLTCILGILLIVAGLENIDFFHKVARLVVKRFKTTRSMILALVFITYIASLISTNDMALLTFLPLTFLVLKHTGQIKYLAFTFILQNIASNLGGMFSPIGNPQNIYLFSYYKISLFEFFKIMAIPTLCSLILIILTCFLVKKEPLVYEDNYNYQLNVPKLITYICLFVLVFLVVCRIIPYYATLPIVIVIMLILDRKAFLQVDYTIPLTFVCLFIFSGNLSNIPAISNLIIKFADTKTFLCAYLSCQLISDVPTSILLSRFTNNYPALLVAVNIASLGLIFSSLCGLISLKCYLRYRPKDANRHGAWYYIGLDLLINLSLLVILYPISYLSLTWL